MKIPEHPLFIKQESDDIAAKIKFLLDDKYIIITEHYVNLIEEVAYKHYLEDSEIRMFD